MPEFRGGWLAEETGRAALEAVPYVGSLLARLAQSGVKSARRQFTQRNNEALAPIFSDGEIVPAAQIRERLPALLASDLSDYQERNPANRFVVLIDEYERLFEQGGLAAAARDNAYDQMVRDFISCAAGVLVAIFGREHLEWYKFRPKWKEWVEQAHHLLGGLPPKDADIFLQAVPVSEPAIRGAIIESASTPEGTGSEKGVLPVILDLAVDHYLALKAGGKDPEPESFTIDSADFANRRDELLRRFLRQYDPGLESTLKRLAVARRFDRDTATFLVREFATGFPLDRLADLVRLSFVDGLPDQGAYVMHQVIREGLMALLTPEDVSETRAALLEHFMARAHSEDPRKIGRANALALLEAAYYQAQIAPKEIFSWWDSLVGEERPFDPTLFALMLEQFERSLLASAEEAEHPTIAARLNKLAGNLYGQGRYAEAEPVDRRALELREANLPPTHPTIATSLNDLALDLTLQGRYAEAEPLHRRDLELCEATLPPTHPSIATILNNLASNLDSQGRYTEAEPLHRRDLELCEANLPPIHPAIATSLNNLASNLDSQGRYAEAEPLHRRALKLREANLPPNHPDIATSLNNLANNLGSQGRYAEAEPLHRRDLELCEANLPPNHPDIATSLNNLANNLGSQGRYAEAEPLHRRDLELCEANLPPNHPDIATSLNNLANNLGSQGRYAEAEALHRRGLELREANLPPTHPSIATSLNNLALNLGSQGRYAEAEALLRRGLELFEANLPPNHPSIAASLNNLALNLNSQGRYAEAEPLYRRALELREANLPPNHPSIATILNNLAGNLGSQGRYAEAEPLYRRALELREANLPPTHPHIATSLNNLAKNLDSQGRHAEAEPLHRRALELREANLPPNHPDIATSLGNLALNLYSQDRHAEAEALLQRLKRP